MQGIPTPVCALARNDNVFRSSGEIRCFFYLEGGDAEGNMAVKNISQERVMRELAAIAFAKVPELLEIDGTNIKLKDYLTPSQRAVVASVEKSTTGIKVKFYDKLKALELLGKHFGLFEGKENQETSKDNNLLEAILRATGQEVDTDDVSELQ